jgi:hypothetical protein
MAGVLMGDYVDGRNVDVEGITVLEGESAYGPVMSPLEYEEMWSDMFHAEMRKQDTLRSISTYELECELIRRSWL